MFNTTFYPTPSEVVSQMLAGVKFEHGELILDPSAGKGDLLDYIKEHKVNRYYSNGHPGLYACEIVPDLRAILEDKGYPVLADDFLTYKPTMYFTKIIMNPPFDHAEEHIFHAFEILGHGEVISLIPTSSLEGKYAKERMLLDMIDLHGEAHNIGPVFRYAERPTSEDISIVILRKAEDPFNLDFETVNEHDFAPNFSTGPNQELAVPGFVPGLVAQYNAAFGAVEEYLKARTRIEKYVLHGYDEKDDPLKGLDSGTPQERYNKFTERMNILAWQKVLDHPQFQAILTDRARKMVDKFRSRQRHMDFNVENIIRMFEQITQMAPDLLEAAIEDAFDTMTQYHKENRVYIEGWKTNLAWKVAPRVILPHYIDNTWPGYHETIRVSYGYRDQLIDIDRAMCVVSNTPFSTITKMADVLDRAPFGELLHSTFFEMRGYKKGTLHLKFRSKEVLDEFNYRAVKGKGWLPDGTQSRYHV